ncbi:hypothetical protein LSAT2_016445 [Lamellibrachia satsuma]|nr:hypothetical protein LSAT2_016445 [Lamellibrachia satsuma]
MGVDPLLLVIPVSIATGQRTDHQYVFARERDTSALQQRRTVLWLETVASSDDYKNVLQDTITLGIAGKQYEDMSPLPTARDG